MTSIDSLIGDRVHQRMWRTQTTQAAVAEALGLDPAAVSRRLRGRTAWKANELYRLAYLLGVSPFDLLPEPDELRPAAALTSKDAVAELKCIPPRADRTPLPALPVLVPPLPPECGADDLPRSA